MRRTGPLEIVTERLRLRELEEADFVALRALDGDPDVQRYVGARTVDEAQTRDYLRTNLLRRAERPRARYHLGITLGAHDWVVGGCMLFVTDAALREAELGYQVHRAHWGQGYATEAAQAMLRFAFSELGLHRIWSTCNLDNAGSWRVMEKLGMRREGHLVEVEYAAGEWRDTLLYAILDREWKGRQDASRSG